MLRNDSKSNHYGVGFIDSVVRTTKRTGGIGQAYSREPASDYRDKYRDLAWEEAYHCKIKEWYPSLLAWNIKLEW